MGHKKLALVMPVYNEESIIEQVLEKWYRELTRLNIDFTINVYNDGSSDCSSARIREMAGKYPGAILARDKVNSGHGPTILAGYREAVALGCDWIFQLDSDDEIGEESFHKLWHERQRYDFLAGVRTGRKQPLARKLMSVASRLCVRMFYGKTIRDVNIPYRLLRVAAFKPVLEEIPANTFAPNVIIAGMAARLKLRCFELPVPQRGRRTGESSIRKWKLLRAAATSLVQTLRFAWARRSTLLLLLVATVQS